VSKALEKEPNRRYASAGELADDLERFLHNEPIAARPASALYQLRKFARRNRVMVAGVAAVIVALTAGVIATAFKAREANAQRVRAEDEALASRQVSSFLHEILTTIDPLKVGAVDAQSLDDASSSLLGNRNITVREALDQASPKIESLGKVSGPHVRASLHRTVGLAYKAVGEHALAEAHLRTAYELLADELGANGQQTLDAANELVLVLAHLKKLDEAHELVTGALNAARASLPADSETVTSLLAAAGIVAYWRGELEESARIEREHLDLMIKLHGPEHRRTLVAMANLGLTLSDLNQFDEADEMLSRCAALRATSLGDNHVETLYARNNLANLRMKQGRMDEAAAIWDDAVARARDVLGPGHPEWQAWIRNLALAHALQGDVNGGITLLEESRGYLTIDGERTHPGALHHMGMLAMLLTEAGRLDDAQPIVDEVHDLSVQVFGPEHIETIRSYTLYYDLAEKCGDEQAMATWAAKLAGTPFDPNPPPAPQAEDDATSSQ
jgi:tetratricopeptide (TPR) repeat protein